MIPITFEQAVDIYVKTRQLGIDKIRILVDDYADQMELYGSCLVLIGDKLLECENRLGEVEDVNRRLVEALQAFKALTPAELHAEASRRSRASTEPPSTSLMGVYPTRVFAERTDEVISELTGEITAYLEAHDAQRAREAQERHPSTYIDGSATESDEIDPNRE